MSWAVSKIDAVTEVVTKGTTPTTYGMPFTKSGVNFIKAEALNGDSSLDSSSFAFVEESTHEKLRRSILAEGDILVTIAGVHVGRCGFVRTEHLPANTNQAVGIIRVLRKKANPRFVYYFFKNPKTFQICQGLGGQAAQPNINLTVLKGLCLPLPGLRTQDSIVDVLSAYDDLIENNRRRIALLEEAARLLYREWFVHFRFPGHEHVKIIDGLPEGWERRTLVELAEVVMGQSPKSKFYNEIGDGLPFHQGVTDYGFRFVSHRTYSTAVTKLAEAGDVLVSVRAPVGRINITRDKIVLGRGLASLRSRSAHQSFLFYALKNHFYAENIIGTGAIYAATNKKELEGQIFLLPSASLLLEFEDQASTIDLQITCLTNQNHKLVQARDLLLSRLMNGEIAV